MPSVDCETGEVLLAAADAIAFNPDGHGGTLRALATSGLLTTLRRRGIEHLSYFQVDNPLVRALDPVFLGLHIDGSVSSAEVTSKAVAKRSPEEKVGVFGVQNGELTVLEYSDLDPEVCEATDGDGKLRFRAGNMAVHAFGLDFLDRLTNGAGLPFHRAIKKVPFFDESTGKIRTHRLQMQSNMRRSFLTHCLWRPVLWWWSRTGPKNLLRSRMPRDRIPCRQVKWPNRSERPNGWPSRVCKLLKMLQDNLRPKSKFDVQPRLVQKIWHCVSFQKIRARRTVLGVRL